MKYFFLKMKLVLRLGAIWGQFGVTIETNKLKSDRWVPFSTKRFCSERGRAGGVPRKCRSKVTLIFFLTAFIAGTSASFCGLAGKWAVLRKLRLWMNVAKAQNHFLFCCISFLTTGDSRGQTHACEFKLTGAEIYKTDQFVALARIHRSCWVISLSTTSTNGFCASFWLIFTKIVFYALKCVVLLIQSAL